MLVVGEEAPRFTFEADDVRLVSLKDYLGNKVVLYFLS